MAKVERQPFATASGCGGLEGPLALFQSTLEGQLAPWESPHPRRHRDLYGQFRTLKEWVYAGYTFNLFGASASHVFSGDGFRKINVAVIIPGFVLASYWPSKNPLDLREH
jgi:hypothetical protein